MKIILEYDCWDGEFRKGDEITVNPTLSIAGDDHILIMYDDGQIDVGRVVISPENDTPLVDTGDGEVHLSTDINIAGKITTLLRNY